MFFPAEAHFLKVRPDQNEYRFYRIEVEVDLFGEYLVSRTFGRIGSCGRRMTTHCSGVNEAGELFKHLCRRRQTRRYLLMHESPGACPGS